MKWIVALLFMSSGFAQAKTIVFFGDSLTEGYGVAKKDSYPYLIKDQLAKDGYKNVKVVNGSISGSTTASAPSRMRWFLKSKPDILVLALGANDGLRGISPENTEKNLDRVIDMAKKAKVKVILCGLRMPPNYGPDYRKKFVAVYKNLAQKHKVRFIPKMLEGVAGETAMNQEDGIHPNEKGHKKLKQTVYPHIKDLL